MSAPTASADRLPEQLAHYRQQFLDRKEETKRLTDGVPDDVLRARPSPEAWSVAECLDHLNTAGWMLLERMEPIMAEAHRTGPFAEPPFEYGIISRLFVRAMEPDAFLSLSSPAAYEPGSPGTLHPHEVVVEFLALQDDLAGCITQARGLDLRRIRVPSPAIPFVRISLGAWFEAAEAHERRHLAQARRTLDAVQSPAA